MVPEGLAFCAAAPGGSAMSIGPNPPPTSAGPTLGSVTTSCPSVKPLLRKRRRLFPPPPPPPSLAASMATPPPPPWPSRRSRGAAGRGRRLCRSTCSLSPQCGVPPGRVQRHHTQPPTRPQCRCLRCLHLCPSAAAKAPFRDAAATSTDGKLLLPLWSEDAAWQRWSSVGGW